MLRIVDIGNKARVLRELLQECAEYGQPSLKHVKKPKDFYDPVYLENIRIHNERVSKENQQWLITHTPNFPSQYFSNDDEFDRAGEYWEKAVQNLFYPKL